MHIGTRAAYLGSYSGVRWSCENDTCDLLKARGKSATEAHYAVAQQQVKFTNTSGMSAMSVGMPFLSESCVTCQCQVGTQESSSEFQSRSTKPENPNINHAYVCLIITWQIGSDTCSQGSWCCVLNEEDERGGRIAGFCNLHTESHNVLHQQADAGRLVCPVHSAALAK